MVQCSGSGLHVQCERKYRESMPSTMFYVRRHRDRESVHTRTIGSMRRLVSLGAIPALVVAVLSLTNAQQTSPSGDVRLVQTAFGTPDRLSTKQPLVWGPNSFASSSTITIDRTKRFQKIIGFGGAFTEAAAYNFALLPADQQEFVLQAYWGADGIGYTVGRVHINRCVQVLARLLTAPFTCDACYLGASAATSAWGRTTLILCEATKTLSTLISTSRTIKRQCSRSCTLRLG